MKASSLFENCNILRCQEVIWDNFNFLHQNWIEKFMFWWFFGKSLRLFLVPEDKIPCYKTTLLKEGACIPFRYRYVHCIADIYARAPFLALKWPFIEQHDIDNNTLWCFGSYADMVNWELNLNESHFNKKNYFYHYYLTY